MKILLAAWAALGAVALPLAGRAAEPGETWKINGDFPGTINYTVVCTLTAEGGHLAGPCKDDKGAVSAATGTAAGSAWELAYDTTYLGTAIHLDYKGDVQADGTLKGSVDAGVAMGTFTAARQ